MRILDFPHAAEHVTKLLEALEKAGMHFPSHMLDRCLHILKHRGPRPLLRMANRLESDLAQQKGVHEHLDYLRKREALMHYPEFRRDGWPIGSGMVESAHKNVVEARLKGTGMHWERKNVNPMLALRNAVCNDRWQEMWQKALKQYQKLEVLRRQTRTQLRAQASLPVGPSSCQEDPPPSTAETEQLSSPVAVATRPSPRWKRKAHRKSALHAGKGSLHQSREVSRETCVCGTPLVQSGRYRPKQYCSDRCRIHACRQRQAKQSSRPSPQLKRGIAHETALPIVEGSSQRSSEVGAGACICGTPLVQSPRQGRPKQYCSDRCRLRAHRQRQANQS